MRTPARLVEPFGALISREGRRVKLVPTDVSLVNGSICWFVPVGPGSRRRLRILCPCGCRGVSDLFVISPGETPPTEESAVVWRWDGNVEKPTLFPSVWLERGCGWHGFLRGGIWESV